MISKKKLLKRIVSLEEALGLKYVPADQAVGGEYDEHVVSDYGFIRNTREALKEKETNGKK